VRVTCEMTLSHYSAAFEKFLNGNN